MTTNNQNRGHVAQALRERFESEAMLGASALPIRLPDPSSIPVVTRQEIDEDEVKQRQIELDLIDRDEVRDCTRCGLATTRTKTVFGVGSPAARIMFVGEGPGHDEDKSGIPFVGRAGELLTKMIEAGMGLRRADVYRSEARRGG